MTTELLIFLLLGVAAAALRFTPIIGKAVEMITVTVHEVGHGIMTVPFGASLPAITFQADGGGQAVTNGLARIQNSLPAFLHGIAYNLTRIFHLFSGYSAPVVVGVLLIGSAVVDEFTVTSLWGLMVLLFLLSTVMFTVSDFLIDGAGVWLASIAGVVGFTAFIVALLTGIDGWWNTVGVCAAVLGGVALFYIPFIATFLMVGGWFAFALAIFNVPFGSPLTFTGEELSQLALVLFSVFLLLSCRSLFTFFIAILVIGVTLFLFFQTWWAVAFSAVFVGVLLLVAGVVDIVNVGRWFIWGSSDTAETDFWLAYEEWGGSPEVWFILFLIVTVITVGLLSWGLFL